MNILSFNAQKQLKSNQVGKQKLNGSNCMKVTHTYLYIRIESRFVDYICLFLDDNSNPSIQGVYWLEIFNELIKQNITNTKHLLSFSFCLFLFLSTSCSSLKQNVNVKFNFHRTKTKQPPCPPTFVISNVPSYLIVCRRYQKCCLRLGKHFCTYEGHWPTTFVHMNRAWIKNQMG